MNARWHQEKTKRRVAFACRDAAGIVRDIVRPAGDPRRHPAADMTWKECPLAVRAALEITKGIMANERAKTQAEAPKTLGIVFMTPQIANEGDWERFAKQGGQVIDTTAGPALLKADEPHQEQGKEQGLPVATEPGK